MDDPRDPESNPEGDDFLDPFRNAMVECLELPPIEVPAGAGRIVRVMFVPSFMPEGAVTLYEEETAARVELVAFQSSFWNYLSGFWHRADPAAAPAEDPPEVASATLWLRGEGLDAWRASVERVDLLRLSDKLPEGVVYMDGTSVDCTLASKAAGLLRARAQLTREDLPVIHALALAVYEAAMAAAPHGLLGAWLRDLRAEID